MKIIKRIIIITVVAVLILCVSYAVYTCGAVGYMIYTCNRLPVEETEGRTAYAIPCD